MRFIGKPMEWSLSFNSRVRWFGADQVIDATVLFMHKI